MAVPAPHSRGGHHHERKNSDDDGMNDDSHDGSAPFVPLEETTTTTTQIEQDDGGGGGVGGSLDTSLSSITNRIRSKSTSSLTMGGGGGGGGGGSSSSSSSSSTSNSSNALVTQLQAQVTAKIKALLQHIPKDFRQQHLTPKKALACFMCLVAMFILWDALITAPQHRWLKPAAFSDALMQWVQIHPMAGWLVLVLALAVAVVFMIPIGTPLTLGCGYIYKGLYGWKLGVFIATLVSMGGSALGAVTCFLLGRYLMRDQVRLWIRKYPLFDAIDIAAAEHGLRIMAMLYLTPILPLGPVSYMCGTTSMALSSFVLAKIASLPLMLLYVFIGASAGALIGGGGNKKNNNNKQTTSNLNDTEEEFKSIEENTTLIVSGILLSMVMIAGITHSIRKELNKILERQEKHKPGEKDQPSTMPTALRDLSRELVGKDSMDDGGGGSGGGMMVSGAGDGGVGDEDGMEMGTTTTTTTTTAPLTAPRQRRAA